MEINAIIGVGDFLAAVTWNVVDPARAIAQIGVVCLGVAVWVAIKKQKN